jgi:RNA polymerase sigma-70 factor, ECF subfamily
LDKDITALWNELRIPLKNFIKKHIPSEQDTEDVLQEVFYKIHSNIESLNDDNRIHAWIYRMTRNAIVDYYRKRDKTVELTEITGELTSETEDDLSANEEIAKCLHAMVDRLPEKYKQAITLTEFQNLTQKEAGETLGLSQSGVKSRVQRGRSLLKETLLGCCKLEFDRRGNIIDYKHKTKDCKFC